MRRMLKWAWILYCVVPPSLSRGDDEAFIYPQTFLQGALNTDDPPSWIYNTYAKKKLRVEAFSFFFNGSEIGNYNVDTLAGRNDLRNTVLAMRDAVVETGRTFTGYFSFPRLPGFFWPEHIDAQPPAYRSYALRSDGSLWLRRPLPPEDISTKIEVTGEHLDITNRQAVDELMANVRRVFDYDGLSTECIGPIYGYFMMGESKLTGTYLSQWSDVSYSHDVVPYPPDTSENDTLIRLGGGTKHITLFTDDDPYYAFLVPPKRAIPLYSQSAQLSFAAYAADHGHPEITLLPADRNEFNHLGPVDLPGHVQWVDLSDTAYWNLWRDWCYETWSKFIEELAREMTLAQQGNPDFKGVIYFQAPFWSSFRASSQNPITYSYYDENEVLQTRTETLVNYAEYEKLNSVAAGCDMDYLMRSPWFTGIIHETTCSIHLAYSLIANKTLEEADIFVDNHHRYHYYFMAQGAIARKVCRDNGKLFGAFARAQYFKAGDGLTPEYFVRGFRRTIPPLQPDIICTIGPWFVDRERLSEYGLGQEYYNVMLGQTGELQDAWLRKMAEYTIRYASRLVMQDTFTNVAGDREPGDILGGTSLEVGNALWAGYGSPVFSSAGSITNLINTQPRASVPVDTTLYNGPILLEADLNLGPNPGNNDWVSIGFMSGPGDVWSNGEIWMLVRRDGRYTVFARGTTNQLAQSTLAVPYDQYKHAMLQYDPIQRIVNVWINGTQVLTNRNISGLTIQPITHVGFTSYHGASGFLAADILKVDNFRVSPPSLPAIPGQAIKPYPSPMTTDINIYADLKWTTGIHAQSHDVYFGMAGGELAFQGNTTATTFNPGELQGYTTYNWRIDEVNDSGVTEGELWTFTTGPPLPSQASQPDPDNGAGEVAMNVDLRWSAGQYATSHDVYLSRTGEPLVFVGNVSGTSWDAGILDLRTSYQWRIDARNELGVTQGELWTFTTGNYPGDFDGDDDVDLSDFGRLQSCFSGSGVSAIPECLVADLDLDNDVDQGDLILFNNCMNGTNLPPKPGCVSN